MDHTKTTNRLKLIFKLLVFSPLFFIIGLHIGNHALEGQYLSLFLFPILCILVGKMIARF